MRGARAEIGTVTRRARPSGPRSTDSNASGRPPRRTVLTGSATEANIRAMIGAPKEFWSVKTGDVLALYTDGVTEAANPQDEEFGTPRLVETLVRARGGSVAQIEAELGSALTSFTAGTPFGDDRTFVLLKRT